jgi:hypothetical protein
VQAALRQRPPAGASPAGSADRNTLTTGAATLVRASLSSRGPVGGASGDATLPR